MPKSDPAARSASITVIGWSFTVRPITFGLMMWLSICWTTTGSLSGGKPATSTVAHMFPSGCSPVFKPAASTLGTARTRSMSSAEVRPAAHSAPRNPR